MDMRYPSILVVGVITIATILAICSVSTMCYWIVKNADDKKKYSVIVITTIINVLLVVVTIYYTYYYVYKEVIVWIFVGNILIVGSTVLYTNFRNIDTVELLIKIGVSVLTNVLWIMFMVGCVYGEIKLLAVVDNSLYLNEVSVLGIWLGSLVAIMILTIYIIYKSQIVIISRLGNCEINKKNVFFKSGILYCINLLLFVFILFAWVGELD